MHPRLELMNNFIGGWKSSEEELFESTREKIVKIVRVHGCACLFNVLPPIRMQLAEQLIEWLMKEILLFRYARFISQLLENC